AAGLGVGEDIPDVARRNAGETIVVGPELVAAMVLGARQVQCIGRCYPKLRPQFRGEEINRLGHRQRNEPFKFYRVELPEDGVPALYGADQALAFHQRRDTEQSSSGIPKCLGQPIAPKRVSLHEIDQQAGIEINQSQEARSSAMQASISSTVRREWAG